jgi:hypothetical protein
MKKRILIYSLLSILSLCFFSCANQEKKKTEQMPSDSLKNAVAQSLNDYSSKLMSGVIDTAQLFNLLKAYLDENPAVYGSAVALAPMVTGTDTLRYAPYVYRSPKGYESVYLDKSYNYSKDQWYTEPVGKKKGCWSDLYYDSGGGNAWMITYSIPVYNADSSLYGVITSDLEVKKE